MAHKYLEGSIKPANGLQNGLRIEFQGRAEAAERRGCASREGFLILRSQPLAPGAAEQKQHRTRPNCNAEF